jgi:anti-anti-sigma factor
MENFEKKIKDHAIIEVVNLHNATIKEAIEFKNIIEEDIRISNSDIIVDLSECHHIDSTFMGVLVISLKKMKANERNLFLIEPADDKAKTIFRITDMYKVFSIFHNLDDALDAASSNNGSIMEQQIDSNSELNLVIGNGISK